MPCRFSLRPYSFSVWYSFVVYQLGGGNFWFRHAKRETCKRRSLKLNPLFSFSFDNSSRTATCELRQQAPCIVGLKTKTFTRRNQYHTPTINGPQHIG